MLTPLLFLCSMLRRVLILTIPAFLALTACVPAKKYNELLAKQQECSDELDSLRAGHLNDQHRIKDLNSQVDLLSKSVDQLKADTSTLGQSLREERLRLATLEGDLNTIQDQFHRLQQTGQRESAALNADLEAKRIELQLRQDRLDELEAQLRKKEHELAEREARVMELEGVIAQKDAILRDLKARLTEALLGFKDKGLEVYEKNGKIYVSLAAKLLFASGSTEVGDAGKQAVIELAKVLETTQDLEIVVEGHTDTDKIRSTSIPRNNWELSALRSTAVVQIMLGNSAMDPTKVSAAGRSEFLPVDVNDKAKNRRIEVVITPDLSPLYEVMNQEG